MPVPDDQSDTISISGFKLPSAGDVSSQLSVFSGEGEHLYGSSSATYDWMKLSNDSTTGFTYMPGATDDSNMFDGILDGITRDEVTGHSNNLQYNNDGVDIDTYNVSTLMQNYRDQETNINEIFIKFDSNNDYITPSMVAFSAELYVPQLCYDYTYKQDGHIYTETNDGEQVPNIDIHSNSGQKIDVTIYIKSLDSDVDFSHISIYSDMNLSKVKYKSGYFKRTAINTYGYTDPESGTLSATCDENSTTIDILCKTTEGNFRAGIGTNGAGYPLFNAGSFTSGDFMYFQYSLDPQNSAPLLTPLDLYVDIQYALADGTGGDLAPVYDIALGDPRRMKLCPPSTVYVPEWGIFNVIDHNINVNRTGQTNDEYYNNLVTQVPQRKFTVDVVALDASQNPPTTPQDVNTSVALELVDIKGFHDVNISCQDPAVAISDLIHLNFIDGTLESNRSTISNFITPYAKEDVAFRIWYIHNGNKSQIINDWTSTVDSNGALISVNNLYNQIPDPNGYCTSTCSTTDSECFECIKTYFGYPLCSRDNFSVRPESFLISINDRNSTGSFHIRDNNVSDTNVKLSADYDYKVDINATNHLDSNNTIGYLRSFKQNSTSALLQLSWYEPTDVGCNDETNTSFDFRFSDGSIIDITMNKDNVGLYKFNMFDNNWTAIDQGVPLHHTAENFFIINANDCLSNSTIVNDDNLSSPTDTRKVGCNISSIHTVDTRYTNINPLSYKDYNITFKPYKFELSNLEISHGADRNTTFGVSPNETYIYISRLTDPNNENNMSLNSIGTISAVGKGGTILSNYVGGCYAEDINITLNTTLPACNPELFTYHFINLDINNNHVTDINFTSQIVELTDNNFTYDLNGSMNIVLNYNYERNISQPLNPKRLVLNGLSVGCADSDECIINADQSNTHEYNTTEPINAAINYVFGRVHAPRYRIEGNDGNITLYYEVYWDGNDTCNLDTLFPSQPPLSVDSVNWYRNTRHTTNDGNISSILKHRGSQSTVMSTKVNFQVENLHYYETEGYPYKTIMDISASPWLIYHRFDNNATANSFDLEFNQIGEDVEGMIDSNAAVNSNRRIMW